MGGGAMLQTLESGSPAYPPTTNLYPHHAGNLSLSPNCSATISKPLSPTDHARLNRAIRTKDYIASGSYCADVFGPVPSRIEVESAISDLQGFLRGYSSSESENNWIQQSLHHHDLEMQQSIGYRRIHKAFHLLQTEPLIQNLVISISSDKGVWDAILNNKAVQNLQGSIHTAKEEQIVERSSNKESDLVTALLKWILGITNSKVVELLNAIGSLVTEMFQPVEEDKSTSELTDLLEEKVRSSMLLSVAILLIVVVTRSHGA